MPAAGASTVACPADAVAPTPPNVVDNCGRTMTASAPVISADPLCAGTKTYTYTFTDCAGRAMTGSILIPSVHQHLPCRQREHRQLHVLQMQ